MIVLVQPPFVQLNTAYPSLYYLRTYLEKQGQHCLVQDHSIALFERIFSAPGLTKLFADAEAVLSRPDAIGTAADGAVDPDLLPVIEQFMLQKQAWIACIDRLVAFLRGTDHEFGHLLALANGVLPSGPRSDALLQSLDYNPAPDDAGRLASSMLADIAGFITAVLDPGFALVHYADSLAAGIRRFSQIEETLDKYILREFYGPYLEEVWTELDCFPARELILGLSLPFPGCLAAGLYCARSAKQRFPQLPVIAGGAYVNTELRRMTAKRFFSYVDYLCFDRGYGALSAVLRHLNTPSEAGPESLYRCRYYCSASKRVIGNPDGPPDSSEAAIDRDAPLSIFPDYSGVDFSRYIRPVDDINPMHRLWSDGRWLKAYLAHGCYWHACAFCDVKLDYIRGFVPVDPEALFKHLCNQAEQSGIRAVHLVDEAAPVQALLRLALLNRAAGLPLLFWGNIRFERSFTPDAAALLAAGGLLGVSAGIEVASEQGFKRIGKGIGLADVVSSCASFKEAGILTHAYLIYGYWDEQAGELVDSAETLRQLFALGLVDSAFWHKFVLTRHSRVYAEYQRGRHASLKPLEDEAVSGEDYFADNDLRFDGEDKSEKYGPVLDSLLASWMAGDTDTPVYDAFPFPVPLPSVDSGACSHLLESYAAKRDETRSSMDADAEQGLYVFLGSICGSIQHLPYVLSEADKTIKWIWRYEEYEVTVESEKQRSVLAGLLEEAASARGMKAAGLVKTLRSSFKDAELYRIWPLLRNGGLVRVALD